MCTSIDTLHRSLSEEAIRFFAFFSRFEFAIKRSGFLTAPSSEAKPDWDRFAASLGQRFLENVCNERVAEVLIESPPKMQIAQNDELAWRPMARVTDVQSLFGAVRRVRNNFFHGEKSLHELSDQTDRDALLIAQALVVLQQALKQSAEIRRNF